MKPKSVYYIVRMSEKNVWRQLEPYHFKTKIGAINLAKRLRKDKKNVFVTTVNAIKVTEEVIL